MRKIEIGSIGKPFNMDGGVKFRGQQIAGELERIYLEGLGYRSIEDAYYVNEDLVLHLSGIADRTAAEKIAGFKVFAEEEELPELEEGEFYFFQLKGMAVMVDEQLFGEVVEVEDAGAQDILMIKPIGESLRAQSKRYLVPLQAPYVEIKEGKVWVTSIPGLFE